MTTFTTVTVAAIVVAVIYRRLPGSAQTRAELCTRQLQTAHAPRQPLEISVSTFRNISPFFLQKDRDGLPQGPTSKLQETGREPECSGPGGGRCRKPVGYSGSPGASSGQLGGHVPGALCLCDSVVLSSVLASQVPPPVSGVSPKDSFAYQNC